MLCLLSVGMGQFTRGDGEVRPVKGNITGDVHYEAATVMGANMDSIANIFIDINGNDQMDNDEICQMADSSQRTGSRIYCTIPTSSEDCC